MVVVVVVNRGNFLPSSNPDFNISPSFNPDFNISPQDKLLAAAMFGKSFRSLGDNGSWKEISAREKHVNRDLAVTILFCIGALLGPYSWS